MIEKMKFWLRSIVGVVAVALSSGTHAQQQPAPQRADKTLNEGVTAVLVDVVVRDKRGQPVRDLRQTDFEVLEDGVPQPIGSFSPIFAGAPPASGAVNADAAASSLAAAASPVPPGPAVTALVFDRLTPEA